MANNCKMCGTPNEDGVQFCAACGSPLDGELGQVKKGQPRSKGVAAKTMMFGMTAPPAQQPPAQQPPVPQSAPQPAQAPMAAPVQPQAQQPAPQPAAVDNNRTMLGVPAVVTAPTPQAAPLAQAPMARPVQAAPVAKPMTDAEKLKAKRTVMGMPAVSTDAIAELRNKVPAGAQPAAAQPVAAQPAPVPAPQPVAAPTPLQEQPRKPAPQTAPLEALPKSDPPHRRDAEPVRQSPPREDPRDHADSWPDEDDAPRKKGGMGLIIIGIVAGVAILAAGGLIVYLLVFKGGSDIKPQVFPSADGNSLTVVLALPDALQGSSVQAAGQVVPVITGQARFDLPMNQMKLGENPIQVTLVSPGGAPEQLTFPVYMRHTVTTDLSGLVAAQPVIVVKFQVAPGIRLAVAGQPVQPAGGIYAHTISLSTISSQKDGTGDSVIHKVPFQLTDVDGTTEAGQHVVTIPLTELRIDRPADKAIVALESITCSGVTEEGAAVTVNGAPVGVTAAGFNTTVPLDAIGDHPITVVARSTGKAPRTSTLRVTRIQSLDAAIEQWSADLDKNLDYPSLARDPNLHAGKKALFSGRVVNISTQKGVTAFLLYVGGGCPAGAKCAIYVAFRGETDAGLQSMVDVYGTVRGTWDVDLTGGRKETMPALDATFVVKKELDKKRKKGRR